MPEQGSSARVEELLARMDVADKVGQLIQYFFFSLPEGVDADLVGDAAAQPRAVEAALERGGAGSLLFVTDPAQINRLQRLAIDGNSHGIPALFGFDVIHGLRTILPVPIALAATWDSELIERAQAVAAAEARAVGIRWTFAPMVDIARDPRWGRMIEGAGEDPLLGGMVAAAQVRGFQGGRADAPLPAGRILAGPKHFAGYGAALGGRDYDQSEISDQELWNVYLPPFRAAIEAGAGNVMAAYMDLNGVPATGNRWLLTDVLREAFGFEGFVVSDANSVKDLETHHFAEDATDAAARALHAGLDLEMAIADAAYAHLADAVAAGRVDEAELDRSVRRVLAAKEAVGLFDDPFVDEAEAARVLADPGHRVVAREAAEAAAVLLRNDGGLLPLDAGRLSNVAVIGPYADSKRDTLGPWVFDFDLDETVTVLEGIRTMLGDRATATHAPGVPRVIRTYPSLFDMFEPPAPPAGDPEAMIAEAVRAAEAADVAIVVLGENQEMIGENASRSSLELPGEQQRLLESVVATGTPVVLVLLSGRPLDLRWAVEHVPAILEAWYPGTRGGEAVANLLLGEASPRGRLPFTWPRSVGQVPIHHAVTRSHDPGKQGQRYWDEASTPLFPFGFGLTYAAFEYGEVAVSTSECDRDGSVEVSVELRNTAAVDGTEVVQLYLHQRSGTSSRPLRKLSAFRVVELAAGAAERVTFTIGPEERRYWSAATRDWVLDSAEFEVLAGPDATAERSAVLRVR